MSAQDRDEKRAQYQVAVATWERAKAVRDYTVIRAPFAGIVTEKFARVGEKVIEDKFDPLFKITATEPLLARVYLPEELLLSVKVGDRVEVVAERFPDVRTTGEVQFVSPSVDAGSGTFQVIVRVRRDSAKSVLRPGLSVKVRFLPTGTR
jgi:membrane fusion protein (multidrug efflux system)